MTDDERVLRACRRTCRILANEAMMRLKMTQQETDLTEWRRDWLAAQASELTSLLSELEE